jgi:hypothetical protein
MTPERLREIRGYAERHDLRTILELLDYLSHQDRPLTEASLSEIEERCRKAYHGPWQIRHGAIIGKDMRSPLSHLIVDANERVDDPSADLEFIANARQDIPALLETIRFLQVLIGDLKEESTAYERGRQDGLLLEQRIGK